MTGEDWEARYWSKVTKTDGCWHWEGAIRKARGGSFTIDGHDRVAHHLSWELHNGPLPTGVRLTWTCENKACVRPDHLAKAANSTKKKPEAKGRIVPFTPRLPITYSPWTERAMCVGADPKLWDGERKSDTARAQQICGMCPVRTECLTEALQTGEKWTVRGGILLSPEKSS